MDQIKVVLADDHKMVREGIKQLLELQGDIRIIGQADDGEKCLDEVKEKKPDVLLLDINMPKINGLEVLQIIRNNNINVKVLLLTIHNEVEYLIKAKEIGFNGYVLKDSDLATLRRAIFAVYNGETYIEPSMVLLLKERLNKANIEDENELTKREIQVLKLIAEGLFNKEIAYKLLISEKTVKNHVSNIFKKIGVSDRTQAAVFAIRSNLVNL